VPLRPERELRSCYATVESDTENCRGFKKDALAHTGARGAYQSWHERHGAVLRREPSLPRRRLPAVPLADLLLVLRVRVGDLPPIHLDLVVDLHAALVFDLDLRRQLRGRGFPSLRRDLVEAFGRL